jgi:hypothetical protein
MHPNKSGGPNNYFRRWGGAKPPTFWKVFVGPPRPLNIDDFRPAPKPCIQNLIKTLLNNAPDTNPARLPSGTQSGLTDPALLVAAEQLFAFLVFGTHARAHLTTRVCQRAQTCCVLPGVGFARRLGT